MDGKIDCRLTPWQVSESEFPQSGSNEETLKFLLRYAILAPSGHNTQPWKFVIRPDGVEIYADRSRRLPVADPDDREMIISAGAAIMTLRIAAARFGYESEICSQPATQSPELLAYVGLSKSDQTDHDLRHLFKAIRLRRTNRGRYDSRPLAESTLAKLQKLTIGRQAGIRIVTDQPTRKEVAELVAEGDRIQLADPSFRKELSTWVRPNSSKRGDGIPAHAFGIPGAVSYFSPWIVSTFNLGSATAKTDSRNTLNAAALAIFHGQDTTDSLLEVGKMLARFVLTLTDSGLQYAFLNQPIEVKALRPKLQAALGLRDLPQLMLRTGYGQPQKLPMPRRPLESVLLKD